MKEREVKNSREQVGLEPISLMIKKSRLRWFGHVEHKDDTDWRNYIEGMPKKDLMGWMTWKVYACPKRMCNLGMEENQGGNQLTQVHLEKWPVKQNVCVINCRLFVLCTIICWVHVCRHWNELACNEVTGPTVSNWLVLKYIHKCLKDLKIFLGNRHCRNLKQVSACHLRLLQGIL